MILSFKTQPVTDCCVIAGAETGRQTDGTGGEEGRETGGGGGGVRGRRTDIDTGRE